MSWKKSVERDEERLNTFQLDNLNSRASNLFSRASKLVILFIVFSLIISGYGTLFVSGPGSENPDSSPYYNQSSELYSAVEGGEESIYNNSFDSWTTGGDQNEWEMGSPTPGDQGPSSAHSGSNMWATDLDDDYSNGAGLVMYLKSPIINTSGFQNITMEYFDWLEVDQGNEDHSELKVHSVTKNENYSVNKTYFSHKWKYQNFPLNESYEGDEVQLNFSFYADQNFPGYGWAIDDVFVNGTNGDDDNYTIFHDDFDDWNSGGQVNRWQLGAGDRGGDDAADNDSEGPTEMSSPPHGWATNLTGSYGNGTYPSQPVMWLESPTIDTEGYVDLSLEFQEWLDLGGKEKGNYSIDAYSLRDGKNYSVIKNHYDNHTWEKRNLSLNSSLEGDKIKIYFSLYSENSSSDYGWVFDDIYLNGTKLGVDSVEIRTGEGEGAENVTGEELPVGYNQTFYSASFNSTYGFIETIKVSWELDTESGGTLTDQNGFNSTYQAGLNGGIDYLNISYDSSNYTDSVEMTVNSPTADDIAIRDGIGENADNISEKSVPVGHSQTFYAATFNDTSGFINNTEMNWSFEGNSGGSADEENNYSSNYTAGMQGGTDYLNLTYQSNYSYNLTITVTSPTVDNITIRDEEGIGANNISKIKVPVGFSDTCYGATFNETSGFINNTEMNWSFEGKSGGSADTGKRYDSSYSAGLRGGNDYLNISYRGFQASLQITVDSPNVDSIELRDREGEGANNISEIEVPVSYSDTFYAAAFNETAGFINNTKVEWSFEENSGGSAEIGKRYRSAYSAGLSGGDDYLNISHKGFSDSLHIIVQKPSVDSIEIRDGKGIGADNLTEMEVPVGYSNTFYAASFNSTSGFIANVPVNWDFENASGGTGEENFSVSTNYMAGLVGGLDNISITLSDNTMDYKDDITIIVRPPTVDYLAIQDQIGKEGDSISNISMKSGETMTLHAVSYNETSGFLGDLEADWVTSNDEVVELSSQTGKNITISAIGNKSGTATIFAIYNGVENSTEIQVLPEEEFSIAGEIDDISLSEDFGVHQIDLRNHIYPRYNDRLEEMYWSINGINESIISISGDNKTGNHIISFISKDNEYGKMKVVYTLIDQEGKKASQKAWINVTSVNDPPVIDQCPDLYVRYGEPYSFDYTPYISDVDDGKEELALSTDEEEHTVINGHKITYTYPEEMLGEERYIQITVSDGEKTSNDLIKVTVTSNYPPENTENLPDITLEEGEARKNVFDLDDYINDPDNDSLYYSYGYTHLNITIDDQDYTVDMAAESEWHGEEKVTFRAEDPTGAIVEQSMNVTVIPVNDPPFFTKDIDPLVIHYNESYTFDLSWYVYDPDNSIDELEASTSDPENISIEGLELTLNYPKTLKGKMNYTVPLRINVSDGINSISQSTNVTVKDNYAPDLKEPLPDVQFQEDEKLEEAFNLDDYFIDIDSETIFYISGNQYVNVNISKNNTVSFSAPKNWNGQERIMIRAIDGESAYKEDYLNVRVLPVNDAPKIKELPYQRVNKTTWSLDISEYISDVDDPKTNLKVSVDNPNVTAVGHKLLFDYQEAVENDTVWINVSDGKLENSEMLNVTIIDTVESETETESNNLIWYLLSVLPIMSGAATYFYFREKKDYNIKDVFLIHESGVLITHSTRAPDEERDEEILAGMFTAVQNFVKDAFAEDEKNILKRMDYGDKTVLIHKGNHVLLAVFFTGGEPDWALESMKNFVEDLEKKYEGKIEDWSGDHEELEEIEEIVEYLLEKNGKYAKGDWE